MLYYRVTYSNGHLVTSMKQIPLVDSLDPKFKVARDAKFISGDSLWVISLSLCQPNSRKNNVEENVFFLKYNEKFTVCIKDFIQQRLLSSIEVKCCLSPLTSPEEDIKGLRQIDIRNGGYCRNVSGIFDFLGCFSAQIDDARQS